MWQLLIKQKKENEENINYILYKKNVRYLQASTKKQQKLLKISVKAKTNKLN